MQARTMKDITAMLREMTFRRKVFGGVEEADVWRCLEELETAYEEVLERQKERFVGRMQERDLEIACLQEELSEARSELARLQYESAGSRRKLTIVPSVEDESRDESTA